MDVPAARSRAAGAALVAATIALGLATRAIATPLWPLFAKIAGDALYATMMFFLVGVIAPRWPTRTLAIVAWTICAAIEASQLAHTPWLDAVRDTLPGRLVLGRDFDARDLAYYGIGVGLGAAVDVYGARLLAAMRGAPDRSPHRARSIIASVVALASPPMVALGAIYISSCGTAVPIAIVVAIACLAPLSAVVVVTRHSRAIGAIALAANVALALFLASFGAAPLDAPAPFAGPLPAASPPPGMAIFQLPTGVIHRTAAFGYRGGAFSEPRDFALAAVLVVHPRGDLLIDAGLGRSLDEQLARLPLPFRLITHVERASTAAEQLDTAHHDRAHLRGILLTHAHWDHVSGAPDLGDVPVLVTADERRFVDEGGAVMAVARGVPPSRYQIYDFEGGPYLGYPRSHDVYGDGAIVVVPAPGHTPGSVIVFVTVPDGHRYAFVGDLAWQREGITEREERPWFMRRSVDDDPAQVREQLLHMASLALRFPELTIVPAHDARAIAALPRL